MSFQICSNHCIVDSDSVQKKKKYQNRLRKINTRQSNWTSEVTDNRFSNSVYIYSPKNHCEIAHQHDPIISDGIFYFYHKMICMICMCPNIVIVKILHARFISVRYQLLEILSIKNQPFETIIENMRMLPCTIKLYLSIEQSSILL